VINLPGLSTGRNDRPLPPIQIDDVYSLKDRSTVEILKTHIEASNEYPGDGDREAFVSELLRSTQIHSEDESGRWTTNGAFTNYVQTEIIQDSRPYFFLEDNWYRLSPRFDRDLSSRFRDRVSPNIEEVPELNAWTSGSETDYNSTYDRKTGPLYLHLILPKNVEICDILIPASGTLYIVHVKNGLGASVRDLTSQLFIAARIVEEEIVSGSYEYLDRLYSDAVERGRIDSSTLPRTNFLSWFNSMKRVYCAAVRLGSLSRSDLASASFDSRIAKFSLVELGSSMHGMDWNWKLVPI